MAFGPQKNEGSADCSTDSWSIDASSAVAAPELLESLYRYQNELRAENEELQRVRADLEALHARYFDLYEFAPVGYATLNEQGAIQETNLRAATLFAVARGAFDGRSFHRLILLEDQDTYFRDRQCLLETGIPQVCEVRMYRRSSPPFWARLEMALAHADGCVTCRVVIVDISGNKDAELRLQESERQLKSSLAEKTVLVREVHHRVKNNLQVISSLLRMQADLIKDQDASAALTETHLRILSMSLIHERLCANSQMEVVDFGEYTQTLIDELFQSYTGSSDHITSRLNIEPVVLNADQAMPCGLILNELVTNALKYAYPHDRTGEVLIDLHEEPSGGITLAVSDNGVGLPEGFDWKTSNSLGLPIVDILSKQLRGKLTVRSRPGTSFTIEFPKNALSLAAGA